MKPWIVGSLCAAGLALAIVPALAQKPTAEYFEKKYESELREAAERGKLMYRLDRAAWVATDEVFSRDRQAKRDERMRGYIVDESEGATKVLFVGLSDETPKALYEVTVEEGRVVRDSYRKYPKGQELTAHQAKLYAALDTARTSLLKKELLQCAENVNIIVYRHSDEASEDSGYRVYILSATSKPDVVIAGGHHRIEINAGADEVVGVHSFSNGCINIPLQAGRKKGEEVVGLLLSHLKTPYPEEIHVFLSLNYNVMFYVLTTENSVGWKVEGSDINAEILPDEFAEGESE